MKRHLQFSIRTTLLSAAIAAVGLFWIRWPTVTASSFVTNPAIDTKKIIVDFDTLDDQVERIRRFASDQRNSTVKLIALDRTFMDVLSGVQHFDYGLYELTARRGKIAVYGPYYSFGVGKMRR